MPGITDVLLPLAALGVGAYTVKKIVTQPAITPNVSAGNPLVPYTPQQIIDLSSGAGITPNAPASASIAQGPVFPNANLQTWASNPQMPQYMTVSDAGKQFIQRHEGYRNTPYQDIAGNWTVGIGHKIQPSDGIPLNQAIDNATVQNLFAGDLNDAANIVQQYVNVPLTQGQFDALVDFVFNLGRARLAGSTLLRLLNAGNYSAAAAEFNKWVYAGNNRVAALVSRRAGETQMFVG